jgi:FKBP-type peptidyl-prolyl cis-trans isomerase SlyD
MKMGSLVQFKVLEIKNDTILVDFNKPTAGISALMEGEVLAVRKASEEEIAKAEENQHKREIGCG